jgi:hypothetical protein
MTEENAGNSTENAAQNDNSNSTANAENMIPKSRFDQVNQQKNELNDTLKGLVDELKADIPEDFQDLIPEMKPADQIKWIRNATKKGIFTKKAESGPDSKAPKSSKDVTPDYSNMGSSELFENYFKNSNRGN